MFRQITADVKRNADKNIKMFSFVEFCLWNAQDDMLNYQRTLSIGEVEIKDSTIYHKTDYIERRNHYAFYSVNTEIDGFDTDRDTFLGAFNGFDTPDSVINGKSGNSVASGWYPIASHQINVSLAPGESKEYIFVLGYIENEKEEKFESLNVINKTKAEEMISRYAASEQCDAEFKKLNDYWDKLLSVYTIKSGDEKLDRMVNIWNLYQCMVTFNMSRSASYYESSIGKEDGKSQKALDSVEKHLECDYGIVFNYPPYSTYHLELGEITSYPQGYKENAGIFCHNNPWIIIA